MNKSNVNCNFVHFSCRNLCVSISIYKLNPQHINSKMKQKNLKVSINYNVMFKTIGSTSTEFSLSDIFDCRFRLKMHIFHFDDFLKG